MLVKLEEDENGDLILPLSDEICKSMGVEIGDSITWEIHDDGTVRLYKSDKKSESVTD